MRYRRDLDCCQRMAHEGRGHASEVRRYHHLAERLLSLVRSLQQ